MAFSADGLPEESRLEITAQIQVTAVAWDFLQRFYSADLVSAWQVMHPIFRLCLVQAWAHQDRDALRQNNYDFDAVVAELSSASGPEHELWHHLERVSLREYSRAYPLDPGQVTLGPSPRVIDLDTELVDVHPNSPQPRLWTQGEHRTAWPLIIALTAGEWKVLNWGYDTIPVPGYPPTITTTDITMA